MIVWTSDADVERLKAEVTEACSGTFEFLTNPTDKSAYRAMEGKCVFLTDESFTRGIDFKLSAEFKESSDYSPKRGIDLCMT